MRGPTRRGLMLGLGAAALPVFPAGAGAGAVAGLDRVRRDWIVSEAEATRWHRIKDEPGPALTGNASWHHFMGFLETALEGLGCVDIHRSSWHFARRESGIWPDTSKWGLVLDGRPVPVASVGASCALTGPQGVTAPLVLWDPVARPDVTGRIVVFRPVPRAELRSAFVDSDYECATPFDSHPVEGQPVPQAQDGTGSISAAVWDEMTATSAFIAEIATGRPAGVVFAMNLNRAATAGLHTFPVPDHYDFPAIYLDRANGDALVAAARANRAATVRVEGVEQQSEAYQLVAFLPGRDYGTGRDQQIQFRTHTDGPSISQDDGALGLLGVVGYMANIPRQDRPRTLFLELDCRHFMPGAEKRWEQQDYFVKNPGARDKVMALVAMEHMGQIEYVADGEEIRPSGRSLPTWIYASANRTMIDQACRAAAENQVRSAVIRSPGRPGRRGASQGRWYGMSKEGPALGLPTYGVQGDLGAYWAFSGRLDRFDARSFCRQVAMFVQLTAFLMTADPAALATGRG
ncbi:hypothetical protein [Niveispirillum fermenti]|uniref:hypothetical protein n=1 Tax=Niveispirillum fermenti TaxID=1233113 RepID=UPI003A895403